MNERERLTEILPMLLEYYPIINHWNFRKWHWDGENLVAISDSYYDPALTFVKFFNEGVLEGTFDYISGETDKIIITDVALELFQAIEHRGATYKNIEQRIRIAKGQGYRGLIKITEKPSDFVTLSDKIIARSKLNAYWLKRGKAGPSSGWEIPSVEDIEKDLAT
ncbi:Hypothetical protein HVR_LOCUS450 [uncultured virus]|nr:Hypothetical protein HVR_LOCUS450 [uncultured virus]